MGAGYNRPSEISDNIQAVTLECMRWIPITPIALPHKTKKDDVYRGWGIPAGTMVLAVSAS